MRDDIETMFKKNLTRTAQETPRFRGKFDPQDHENAVRLFRLAIERPAIREEQLYDALVGHKQPAKDTYKNDDEWFSD